MTSAVSLSTVLIGVDASTGAEDAIAFAARLGDREHVELVVASVFPPEPAAEAAARQTAERMRGLLRDIPVADVRVAVVADASPARGLRRLAARERAALIVVGAPRARSLGRLLERTTVEHLLPAAPCPVAVVPDGFRIGGRPAVRSVGVVCDGSKETETAIAAGIAAARGFGAHLELLEIARSWSDDPGERALHLLVAGVPAGVDVSGVRLEGDPVESLVARTSVVDLLIMSSRGLRPLRSALAGEASQRVVREARCPVIAIPRGVDAQPGGLFSGLAAARGPGLDDVSDDPSPILAAFDPVRCDRAPIELAIALRELAGEPVIAGAVVRGAPDDDGPALEHLREELGVRSVTATGHSVPDELHALARREHAGLIVVGSTHRARLGRVLPGSTAERLLHGAPCPVALAPRGYRRAPIRTVAVGYVDTPEGRAALTAAHLLARAAGARLRVVAVRRPSDGLDAELAHDRAAPEDRRDVHERVLSAIASLPAGVDVVPECCVDEPGRVLLRISEDVDVIVCGSRGYGPVRSVLLGGVSRRLVDDARCVVIVLPRAVERPLELLARSARGRTTV